MTRTRFTESLMPWSAGTNQEHMPFGAPLLVL